jgi:hypothetical protein
VPDDDWEAASVVVMNGSLKASRKMNKSFELLCNFPFLWGVIGKRADVCANMNAFSFKKLKVNLLPLFLYRPSSPFSP